MRALAVAGVCAVATLAPAAPALAQQCPTEPDPHEPFTEPTPQQRLLALDRVAPLATGDGVTVAVLDTGVDDGHPQLTDAVVAGFDVVTDRPGGTVDCAGRGTAVASIIAARPDDGVEFAGVAPAATILPIRVSERHDAQGSVPPAPLAAAIRAATERDPDVITISVTSRGGSDALAAAVAEARGEGALVVATVGTLDNDADDATPPHPEVYPAAYPDVLGVAGVDESGARPTNVPHGSYVDLVAPGEALTAAAPPAGHTSFGGSDAAATAVVGGVAALVADAHPHLTPGQVVDRLIATADPVPDTIGHPEFARPMVNPYRAVTEALPGGRPRTAAGIPPVRVDPAVQARAAYWDSLGRSALLIASAVLAVTAVVTVAIAIRRHRATTLASHGVSAAPPPPTDEVDVDSYFEVPRPRT